MQYTTSILAAATLLSTVSAHGLLTSPQPRLAGTAMKTACGEQVYNNQASDSYGNIQGELQVAKTQTDYDEAACNIWLCKGYKFADNSANIQSWTAGQVVDFKFDVRAPHTGYANVSIVNTATNAIIGSPLLVYDDFGDNSKTIPANETSFSITIPSDLGTTCNTAGACVLQHYWNAASIDQTYESCIDFSLGGDSAAAPVASSAAAVATSAVVVASSSVAAVETSAAAVATSAAAAPVTTSVAPVVTSAAAPVPTTLQTLVRPSSAVPTTTSAALEPVSTGAADDEYDEDC